MFDIFIQLNLFCQFIKTAVDPHPDVTAFLCLLQKLHMFPFSSPNHGSKQLNSGALRLLHQLIHHLINGLFFNLPAAFGAMGNPHPGIQQSKIVINLRHCSHRRSGISVGRFLVNGDGRRKSFNALHLRFFHLSQKLSRIRGERLHISPLSFRVDGIKSQRRLTGTG